MKELLWIQQQCISILNTLPLCEDQCKNGHYCLSHACKECDCSRCLNHIHWNNSPTFHYECERITYYYILRFSNRFASEITHFVNFFKIKENSKINIVSLGCGPASEIFGFIKSIRMRGINSILHFEGYDLKNVWQPVQELTKVSLSKTGHYINFHTKDLFTDFSDFPNNESFVLVLNYLLSDIAKFSSESDKQGFIDKIVDFICNYPIKGVFFNDIAFYGDVSELNSGVQVMNQIILQLMEKRKIKTHYMYFPSSAKLGDEDWHVNKNNQSLFTSLKGNPYMQNVEYCKSKQIFVQLT